jgi:hypothetical protein
MTWQVLSRRQTLISGIGAASVIALPSRVSATPTNRFREAFLYAYPIYEYARTAWGATVPRPQRPALHYNKVAHQRRLGDATNRAVTTPNNDTVYSTARLDVGNGPVLFDLPSLSERYYSVAFMNAFTDNFAFIGTRTTYGIGGLTEIVGPNWRGKARQGVRRIRSQTDDVWMLARVLVSGPDDLPAAIAAQEKIKILEAGEGRPLSIEPRTSDDPENFLAVVNAMLARMSLRDPVGRRARQFRSVGLEPGNSGVWSTMDERTKEAWRTTTVQTQQELKSGFGIGGDVHQGWSYPHPAIGNAGRADLVRSAVALSGLAALPREEATFKRAWTSLASLC